jgi:membrane protein YdbS with pleckstrin-like domain
MDIAPTTFQARCVCGQLMTIRSEQIGQHAVCPACNRTLIPVMAQNVTAPQPATSAIPVSTDSGNPDAALSDTFFSLHVSQWDNFWRYLTCAVFLLISGGVYLIPGLSLYANTIFGIILLVDLISVCLIFLSVRGTRYLINADRIELRSGVFTKEINWISINSVLDIQLKQTFIQRLLGIGAIRLKSTDVETPLLELNQIPEAHRVFEFLQRRVSRPSHGYTAPKHGAP